VAFGEGSASIEGEQSSPRCAVQRVTGNSSGCCVVQDAHGVSVKDKHGGNRSLSDLKFLQKRKFGLSSARFTQFRKTGISWRYYGLFLYGLMKIASPEGKIFENRKRKNGRGVESLKSH